MKSKFSANRGSSQAYTANCYRSDSSRMQADYEQSTLFNGMGMFIYLFIYLFYYYYFFREFDRLCFSKVSGRELKQNRLFLQRFLPANCFIFSNVGCRRVPYTSSFTEVKDGHALHGRLTHDKLLRPRKYDGCVPILSALGLECFLFLG